MDTRSEILNAWLLHSRPFRDTSLLLDFLTLEKGRVSAVARGVRNSRSKGRSSLQPFTPLHISLTGKHELQTLRSFESSAPAIKLQGNNLFAGFYLNELIVKLLPGHEPEQDLVKIYVDTLTALEKNRDIEPLLRIFELQLLESLGYGLQLHHDTDNGDAIDDASWYYLQPESGFVKQLHVIQTAESEANGGLYPGFELKKIAAADYLDATTRKFAKRMLRQVLQFHLGTREITSRALFGKSRSTV